MKGHATIELTDVKTGEVQKIEEDNMVTNAIKYFCASAGRLANVYFPSDPLYTEMLGGLFAWDTQIEENVENVLPPGEAGVTAIGCTGVSNSGTATNKMGSYNASESGKQIDGSVKMVFDYATNQGNGEIACLTLTSKTGARSGYDWDLPNVKYDDTDMYTDNGSRNITSPSIKSIKFDTSNDSLFALGDYSTNLTSGHENEYCTYTGKLKIYKYELGIKKYMVNRKSALDGAYTSLDVDLPDIIMTAYSKKNAFIQYNVSEEHIYLKFSSASTIKINGIFHILKMDKNLNIVSVYEMKNTLPYDASFTLRSATWVSDTGYIYSWYNYKHYRIKMDDYADVSSTDSKDNSKGYQFESNGRLFYGTTWVENDKQAYLNVEKFKEEYTGSGNYHPLYYGAIKNESNPLHVCSFYDSKLIYCRNWGYLATINNLATPVTKTPSQTMKITYILTFDDETETSSTT